MKANDVIGKRQLDKIAEAHHRDTILFNERMARLDYSAGFPLPFSSLAANKKNIYA